MNSRTILLDLREETLTLLLYRWGVFITKALLWSLLFPFKQLPIALQYRDQQTRHCRLIMMAGIVMGFF